MASSSSPSSPAPSRRPILVVGLTVHSAIPAYFRALYGTPAEIQARIDGDVGRGAAAGYALTGYQMRDDAVPEGLRWLEDELRARRYDAVVNTVRTLAPSAPLLFNEGPGTNVEALERTFGKSA